MTTSKYLTALGAFGSGPSMFIPHIAKSQGELRLWRLLGGVHGISAKLLTLSASLCEVKGVCPECWLVVASTHHLGCKEASSGVEIVDSFMEFSHDIICLLAVRAL